MSLLPGIRRHRSWMTTKSPNLNISVFLHPWVWGLENPRETRWPCVFVPILDYTHDLTRILTSRCLHVSTSRCMSNVWSSYSPFTWRHDKTTQKIFRYALISKIHRPVFTIRLEHGFFWSFSCTQILVFLSLKSQPPSTDPSLCWRPIVMTFHVETLGGNVLWILTGSIGA